MNHGIGQTLRTDVLVASLVAVAIQAEWPIDEIAVPLDVEKTYYLCVCKYVAYHLLILYCVGTGGSRHQTRGNG